MVVNLNRFDVYIAKQLQNVLSAKHSIEYYMDQLDAVVRTIVFEGETSDMVKDREGLVSLLKKSIETYQNGVKEVSESIDQRITLAKSARLSALVDFQQSSEEYKKNVVEELNDIREQLEFYEGMKQELIEFSLIVEQIIEHCEDVQEVLNKD